jgi:hypothetical protein
MAEAGGGDGGGGGGGGGNGGGGGARSLCCASLPEPLPFPEDKALRLAEEETAAAAAAPPLAGMPPLAGFTALGNFRDVASANPACVRPGRVYRSATPAEADQADVMLLLNTFCVRTIIDFRDRAEAAADPGSRLYTHYYPSDDDEGAEAPVAASADRLLKGPRVVRAPYVSKAKMALTLLGRMPLTRLARVGSNFALGLLSKGAKAAAHREVFAELNDLGLEGLYRTILDGAGAQIARALRVVADRRNHPVLLHCSHGKDRTGVTVALLLVLVGAPAADIVADYHLSEAHGLSPTGRAFFKHPEMDPDYWGRAPPTVMAATLAYLDARYGGVPHYLTHIGFTPAWQQRLVAALTHP